MQLRNINNKSAVSLDNVCYLITVNEDDSETEQLCFCSEIPVNSSEFFKAGQIGIKSSKALVIDSENYSDEEKVKYEDIRYCVYRIYPREDGLTELYLTLKVGG